MICRSPLLSTPCTSPKRRVKIQSLITSNNVQWEGQPIDELGIEPAIWYFKKGVVQKSEYRKWSKAGKILVRYWTKLKLKLYIIVNYDMTSEHTFYFFISLGESNVQEICPL